MNRRPIVVARVALFAALVYVLSWGTSYLPNINFVFFIVFSAGLLWGAVPGMLVGAVGMGLWTLFNPYGPAAIPVMLAQVIGSAGSGLVGAVMRPLARDARLSGIRLYHLVAAAVACTLAFFIPVSVVDAWIFGPFVERLAGGMIWAGVSLVANIVIFPLLFGATRYLYERGWAFQ